MSLVSDPALVAAERQLAVLQLDAMKQLQPEQTADIFHEIVDESLGHSHSYDRFLTPASLADSSSPSAAAAAPASLHRQILALRSWVGRMVREAPSAAGSEEVSKFVSEQAATLGCTAAVSSLLTKLLLARLGELVQDAKVRSVRQFAPWSLKEFDWNARVTLASSALSNLRTPVLQLTLTLAAPDGRTRDVQLEMDRDGLDRVLDQMAKVNGVVQEYSTTTSA